LYLARICTGIYFGYYAFLPILNLIDLYFFENKKEKAKEHVVDLKKTIVYYILKVFNLFKKTFKRIIVLLIRLMPSDSWVDYHIVAAKYYF
jgi:hypothetical protein